jgi:hypothetical protein
MHTTASAMKILTYTTAAALMGLGLFAVSLTLGHESTGAFAVMVATMLVLGFVRDYSPRQSRWEPAHNAGAAHFPSRAHVIHRRAIRTRIAA